MRQVLVDTGPLVGILSSADQHHATCVETLRHLPGPLLSCWPVITEAAWLLRAYPRAVQQLLRSTDSGFLELLPLAGTESKALAEAMKTYADIQPQFADAALVYLADRRASARFSASTGGISPCIAPPANDPFVLFQNSGRL